MCHKVASRSVTTDMLLHLSDTVTVRKVKVISYTEQYPILRIAQSTLHFAP